MKTIFNVFNFLNKLEGAVYLTIESDEILIRVKEVLTNLFQDVNSEKLESPFEKVRQIVILFRAGDLNEVPDVVKNLSEDVKALYKEYKLKNIQKEIY